MNFDNILPFCEFSPLPFDCCEESMQFANFCSNYEPLWFLPVLTSDGVLSLLQNEFASLRQPAHYAVQRYSIIISSRSLLPRRLRSRQRRSKHFSQKICTPPTSLTGWGRVYPAQTVRSPESICQREEPSEWMALLFVSCEHYGSTDSSKICGNTPPAKLAPCRPGNCFVRQTKPSALYADAVLRTELPDGRTTGSLRGPYSKKRCHPNGWHLFLEQGTGIEPASVAWEATVLPMN